MRLQYSNGIIALKDKKGIFQDVTPGWASVFEHESPQQIVGMDDYTVAERVMENNAYSHKLIADEFRDEDEAILQGQHLNIFEIMPVLGQLVCSLTHKVPYFEHNRIQGNYVQLLLMPNLSSKSVNDYLSNPDIFVPEHTRKYLGTGSLSTPQRYGLTQRQEECLKLLVKGFSARDIAKQLYISTKTAEFHIANLKEKLSVKRTTELIAKVHAEELM